MMQELSAQKDTRPCLICSKEGTRHPVEVLPDGGILFMVAHDDGQICKWAEYSSILNVTRPEKKKAGTPTHVTCPKCGDRGRLNWAYDIQAAKGERPFTFKYIVVHERVSGTWGKEKMKRHRRCQSFTPEQRIAILKQVGRYIADPPKPRPDRNFMELDRYIEPQSQKQNGVETEEENVRAQVKQDRLGQTQHKGVVFVPRGKRLTNCAICNKSGYRYRTYFQHYNEPPIGKIKLKGKVIGEKYRRCYLAKEKAKQDQHTKKGKANSVPVQKEKEKSSKDIILKKLDRFVVESGSALFKEDDTGKDYKKMYWDLIDNLKNIVEDQGWKQIHS